MENAAQRNLQLSFPPRREPYVAHESCDLVHSPEYEMASHGVVDKLHVLKDENAGRRCEVPRKLPRINKRDGLKRGRDCALPRRRRLLAERCLRRPMFLASTLI